MAVRRFLGCVVRVVAIVTDFEFAFIDIDRSMSLLSDFELVTYSIVRRVLYKGRAILPIVFVTCWTRDLGYAVLQ